MWLGLTSMCLNITCSTLTILSVVRIHYETPITGSKSAGDSKKWLRQCSLQRPVALDDFYSPGIKDFL